MNHKFEIRCKNCGLVARGYGVVNWRRDVVAYGRPSLPLGVCSGKRKFTNEELREAMAASENNAKGR